MLQEIPADDAGLVAALTAEGLPTADLGRAPQRFFAARLEGRVVARVGLEGEGEERILRSLVIAPEARRSGLARRVLAEVEAVAAADGVRRLWLLTTTAAAVFDRLGWRRVPRAEAPGDIAASAEFAALCPASAVCMMHALTVGSTASAP